MNSDEIAGIVWVGGGILIQIIALVYLIIQHKRNTKNKQWNSPDEISRSYEWIFVWAFVGWFIGAMLMVLLPLVPIFLLIRFGEKQAEKEFNNQ